MYYGLHKKIKQHKYFQH